MTTPGKMELTVTHIKIFQERFSDFGSRNCSFLLFFSNGDYVARLLIISSYITLARCIGIVIIQSQHLRKWNLQILIPRSSKSDFGIRNCTLIVLFLRNSVYFARLLII